MKPTSILGEPGIFMLFVLLIMALAFTGAAAVLDWLT